MRPVYTGEMSSYSSGPIESETEEPPEPIEPDDEPELITWAEKQKRAKKKPEKTELERALGGFSAAIAGMNRAAAD